MSHLQTPTQQLASFFLLPPVRREETERERGESIGWRERRSGEDHDRYTEGTLHYITHYTVHVTFNQLKVK